LAAKDSDAREKRMRALVSGQDGKATHLSSLMESRLEKARERTADARVEKRYEGDVWVDAEPARRPVLVRLDAQTVPFDGVAGDAGVRVPDLWVGNQDHIAVTGDNGCGKTTLVRRLVSLLPNDTHTLYVPQEVTAEQAQELRKRLAGLDRARKGQALSMVAQLNSDPERVLDDGPTSPGETRKLALALGALDHPQLIVMDEPTNHLDIGSVTALERALASFPAALVLVTHDARMVERATSVRWQISRAADGASSRLVVE
jgi:macrolide transport system ATP-binding/permease protein